MPAGRVGRSGAEVLAGGGAELGDDPRVALGVGLQEVAAGRGGAESGVDDAGGGLAVEGDADRVGDGAVDGAGDQRVDEFERAAGDGLLGEDAGLPEAGGAVGH
ncbi:hypothetical protein GCM10010305_41060 [Streptomyces termitum]|uniref:Uncharacterized protein n=1 Tax=Streptomyces termitum TaxID=67368 RepID=A0A918WCD5_9ACTN|nr:hypothetical protein GCM10010305_41060 [Streptomyces termitum]